MYDKVVREDETVSARSGFNHTIPKEFLIQVKPHQNAVNFYFDERDIFLTVVAVSYLYFNLKCTVFIVCTIYKRASDE